MAKAEVYHIHTHTHTHTYTHTHIHTYTHARAWARTHIHTTILGVHQCPQYGIKQCGSRRSLLRPLYSSTRKRSGKYTSATGSDSDADGHLSAGSGTDSDCNDEAVRTRKATALQVQEEQQATLQQTQTQTQTQPKHRKRLKTSSKADYNSALEELASRSCSLDELHNLNADARSAKLASLQLSDIHRSAITEMLKPKSLKKVSDSETIRTGAVRMLDRNNLSLQYLSTLSADARFETLQRLDCTNIQREGIFEMLAPTIPRTKKQRKTKVTGQQPNSTSSASSSSASSSADAAPETDTESMMLLADSDSDTEFTMPTQWETATHAIILITPVVNIQQKKTRLRRPPIEELTVGRIMDNRTRESLCISWLTTDADIGDTDAAVAGSWTSFQYVGGKNRNKTISDDTQWTNVHRLFNLNSDHTLPQWIRDIITNLSLIHI